jgi:hypothetical protein
VARRYGWQNNGRTKARIGEHNVYVNESGSFASRIDLGDVAIFEMASIEVDTVDISFWHRSVSIGQWLMTRSARLFLFAGSVPSDLRSQRNGNTPKYLLVANTRRSQSYQEVVSVLLRTSLVHSIQELN